MRGPQIMRDISKLVAEKVCCSRPLRPIRKVEGPALTASPFSRSRFMARNGRCLRAPGYAFEAFPVGKATRDAWIDNLMLPLTWIRCGACYFGRMTVYS